MSHDQWRECVQKCCGVIEHGINPVEMCGLSGSYTRVWRNATRTSYRTASQILRYVTCSVSWYAVEYAVPVMAHAYYPSLPNVPASELWLNDSSVLFSVYFPSPPTTVLGERGGGVVAQGGHASMGA